jgi:hypothetical protein
LAAAQAAVYGLLLDEGWLKEEEAALVRWATNSATVAPPAHATRAQYKQATAVEALVRVVAGQSVHACPAAWYAHTSKGHRVNRKWLLAAMQRSAVRVSSYMPTQHACS